MLTLTLPVAGLLILAALAGLSGITVILLRLIPLEKTVAELNKDRLNTALDALDAAAGAVGEAAQLRVSNETTVDHAADAARVERVAAALTNMASFLRPAAPTEAPAEQ